MSDEIEQIHKELLKFEHIDAVSVKSSSPQLAALSQAFAVVAA
jgi:hypothetical protein